MIRNDLEDISDKDFLNIVKPFDDVIDKYIENNILYDYVAFYIAKGYEFSAIWESDLKNHVNSSIENLSAISFKDSFNYDRLSGILSDKYNLKVTSYNPLKIEEQKK